MRARRNVVVGHVVTLEPVLVAPDVDRENRHEAKRVKDELLDGDVRNELTAREIERREQRDARERGPPVLEREKRVSEHGVEEESDRDQSSKRPPVRPSAVVKAILVPAGEPPEQTDYRHEINQETDRVAKRRGVLVDVASG